MPRMDKLLQYNWQLIVAFGEIAHRNKYNVVCVCFLEATWY